MFTRLKKFFRTHRQALLLTTTLTAATLYFLVRHLHSLFASHQRRLAEERFNREQIRRRFEQTQRDAVYTIFALGSVLASGISGVFDVEQITTALKARRGRSDAGSTVASESVTLDEEQLSQSGAMDYTKKSKNDLWNDLKIQSITKFLTMLYSHALLIIFTRLQLNILARREYLEDALRIASEKHGVKGQISMVDNSSYINEQAYLSFSWWLLNRGHVAIRSRVENAVKEVFVDINPRAEFSIAEFGSLLQQTMRLVERVTEDGDSFVGPVLLPPRNLEQFVMQQILDDVTLHALDSSANTELRLLLDETSQYVNSSSTLIVLSALMNNGLETLLSSLDNSNEDANKKFKLAVLLAGSTKASNEFKVGQNTYVEKMDGVGELDELSASVYSNFE